MNRTGSKIFISSTSGAVAPESGLHGRGEESAQCQVRGVPPLNPLKQNVTRCHIIRSGPEHSSRGFLSIFPPVRRGETAGARHPPLPPAFCTKSSIHLT